MDSRQCPSCNGTNLINGNLDGYVDKFKPDDCFTLFGYTPRAFVCLDCAFLGHYLDPDDIQDLRRKLKSQG